MWRSLAALRRICIIVLPLLAVTGVVRAEINVLDEAEALIRAGKGIEAVELLSPLEAERAGEPAYDYLLGLALIDAGRPALAVFALERVLDVEPDHVGARSELARAYYLIGENEAARQEFQTVQHQEPPPEVQKTIDKYLSAIETRTAIGQPHTTGYLQAGAGVDTNVNAATGVNSFAVPALGGLVFTLGPLAREQSSPFWTLSGGASHVQPLRANLNGFVAVDADTKRNASVHMFDTITGNASAGLHYLRGRDQFRVALKGQWFYLDEDINRRLFGATGQWQRTLSARDQVTVFGQGSALRYPGQEARNVNQYIGGAAWARALGGRGRPVVFASAYLGTDTELNEQRQDIGRNIFGGRIGGEYTLDGQTKAFAALSYQHSNYGSQDPVFLEERKDNLWDFSIGVTYEPARSWEVKPQFRYTNNKSTLSLNEYDRTQIFVTARRTFD